MGDVFEAADEKLGRAVAVKVLRELFGTPEGRARFEREARLLAALNHPHIATLHGLEDADGLRFLVMELVPGPTLAGRLARSPLPTGEAVRLAVQLAEALEAAHGQDIIHRDLKPANLKLTPEGRLKVLDFGLAKVLGGEGPAEEGMTREGTILGTPAYMSPEQASGAKADRRSDVWAFGCVLFEMLAGRRAFPGNTASETLAAVQGGEPDWAALPAGVPERLRLVLERCLRRDPRRRLHDIADARIELEDALVGPQRPRTALSVPASSQWHGELLLSGSLAPLGPALSPDGQSLAFLQFVDRPPQVQVAVMALTTAERRVLTTDRLNGMVSQMCWSRDGGRIYFDRWTETGPAGVFRVSLLNGTTELVREGAVSPQLLPDNGLLVGRRDAEGVLRMVRCWPDRGRDEFLPPALAQTEYWPPFLAFPNGREVVFWEGLPGDAPFGTLPRLCVLDLATKQTRALNHCLSAREVPDLLPSLAVAHDGGTVYLALRAVPQRQARILALAGDGAGPPLTLLADTANFDGLTVGRDGAVFVTVSSRGGELLRFTARGGNPERLARSDHRWEAPLPLPDGRILFGESAAGRHRVVAVTAGRGAAPFVQTDEDTWLPAAAIDGRHVAVWVGPSDGLDLAVVPADGGRILERYEVGGRGPMWTLATFPGGGTFYFAGRDGIWSLDAQTGRVRRVGPGTAAAPAPDGRSLYTAAREGEGMRLVRRPADGGTGEPVPMRGDLLLHGVFPLTGAAAGPDGRLAVLVNARDDYFNIPALLDPATGDLQPVRLDYDGDVFCPTWAADGGLLALGYPVQSALWQFRPVAGGAPPPRGTSGFHEPSTVSTR
jgi:hypothetical protein